MFLCNRKSSQESAREDLSFSERSGRFNMQVLLLEFQQVRGQHCPRTDAYHKRTIDHFGRYRSILHNPKRILLGRCHNEGDNLRHGQNSIQDHTFDRQCAFCPKLHHSSKMTCHHHQSVRILSPAYCSAFGVSDPTKKCNHPSGDKQKEYYHQKVPVQYVSEFPLGCLCVLHLYYSLEVTNNIIHHLRHNLIVLCSHLVVYLYYQHEV